MGCGCGLVHTVRITAPTKDMIQMTNRMVSSVVLCTNPMAVDIRAWTLRLTRA